ncbi:multidrug efflux protein [Symmachiella dynata]|uniref:SMR family transporter n=1 Tax=Symmachiella dynata TaxID=2527995 RepID=UPI001189B7DF|nr:SMR family transporter [Symmachiella dynata]QDT46906.1 multidrug efflux protein [Symmachiella dynata]
MPFDVFLQVLLAAVFHAAWNFGARRVSGNVGVMWFGQFVGSLICLPFAIAQMSAETSLLDLAWICLPTGILHAVYFWMLAQAYRHGDISLVYPIARGTGVAGTAVLAFFLLGEQLSLTGFSGILTICAGILLLGLSGKNVQANNRGIVMALCTGAAIAGYSLVDKRAVGQINPVVYGVGLWLISAVLFAPAALWKYPNEVRDALKNKKRYILLVGSGSVGTYLVILFAFQRANVSYVAAVREFAVVIGAALGFIVLKERFTAAKAWGIAAIVLGLVLVKAA